jgi:hypothetical protein
VRVADQTFVPDTDLERALLDLGQHVEYPATPDLASRVRVRLTQMPLPVRRRAWFFAPGSWQRAAAVAAVAVLVLFGASLAISSEVRNAVAERLGLRGVTIEHVPEMPTPTAAPTAVATPLPAPAAAVPSASPLPTATPAPPGAALGLGQRTSLVEARTQAGFPLLVPSALGPPDAVYVLNPNQVSLVYGARPGLPAAPQAANVGALFTVYRATIDQQLLFGKGVPPGARVEEVRVGESRAFFISGAPHVFFVRDARGQVVDDRSRLAGNTLLWEQNGLTVRLESALDRDAAMALASTLR